MDNQLVTPELNLSANELEDYFSSISDSFDNTWAAKQRRDYVGYLLSIPVFLTLFSVLPAIPIILTSIIQTQYSNLHIVLAGWAMPLQNFVFWWVVCIVLSVPLAVLAFRIDTARSKRALKERLGPASMRFALCYAIVKELDRFTKNGLQWHAERAHEYWTQLQPMTLKLLDGLGSGGGRSALNPSYFAYSNTYSGGTAVLTKKDIFTNTDAGDFLIPSLFPEIYYLQREYTWFKLEPTTSKIINALSTVPWKITTRMRDRKDVSSVASSLLHFASFLYTFIPVISGTDRHSGSELAAIGEHYLLQFADSLEGLSFYKPEPQPLEGKEKAGSKLAIVFVWFDELFMHESPVVKFFVWWVLAQAIVIFGLVVAHHYIDNLKMDSTLVTLIIATPLVVSAAALAGPFHKR